MKYSPENKIVVKCKGHKTLPIDQLLEFQGGLKRLTQKNREKLIGSICERGFIAPIFVWDDKGEYRLLDGHQRLKTLLWMREKGWDIPMLPVDIIDAEDEQDAKKKLLAITSQYGEFDLDGFIEFTSDIEIDDTIRLTDGEFDIQIRDDVAVSEQDNEMPKEPADELQEKWNVQLGDVWECGDHIIACGSSDDEGLVSKLLADKKPCVCFTDPPYGVSIGDKNKMLNEHNGGKSIETNILNDTMTPEALKELLVGVFTKAKKYCSDECSFFVCSPQGGELGMMMMMMREAGLLVRHVLMWKKNCPTFSMGRLDYDYAHEPILFTWGKKHKKIMGGSMRSSVWEVNKPKACDLHPTMKPVELYINAYLNNSEEGDYAYEPFSGSGTALLAGEKTKRKVVAIELDPKYVSVALERWSEITGKQPVKQESSRMG
jgi:DNA modification methylase